MRTFEYVCFEIASSSLQPLCCFAKTEIQSDFICVSTVILKKQLRFSHNYTVSSLVNCPR